MIVFAFLLCSAGAFRAQTVLLNLTNPNTAGGVNAGYTGSYTFTQTGFYHITVKGSVGGSFFSGGFFDPQSNPGKGATVEGVFYFVAGTTIEYTLGAPGIGGYSGPTSTGGLFGGGGGGGGGTGVRLQNAASPLIVAGGGGGAGPYGVNGNDAYRLATGPGSGQGGGAGSTNVNSSRGSGGGSAIGQGGGAFFDGVSSGGSVFRRYLVARGGNPGYGATGGCCGENFGVNFSYDTYHTEGGGGFGGGGAGITRSFAQGETDVKLGGSGGGGGYTGGVGGTNTSTSQGGYSYSSGTEPNMVPFELDWNNNVGAITIKTAQNPFPVTTTNSSCNNDGTATVHFGGSDYRFNRQTPYSYKWYKNGQLVGSTNPIFIGWDYTTTLSGLAPGDYYVEIFDKNNIRQNPWPPQYATVGGVTLVVTPNVITGISSPGDSAVVNFTVTGGTAPYTGGGTRKFAAGLQTFTVSDNAGCSKTISYFVCPEGQPITGQTAICNGQSATLNANANNKALQFTRASNQYITVPHSSGINLGASFTLEAWVNYSGTNITIVDKGDYDFLWQLNPDTAPNKLAFTNKGTAWVSSNGNVPQNVWTHVAVTLSNGTLTFYINGIPSGSSPVGFAQDNQLMTIGRQQPISGGCQCNHFNGTMDELRIWNVARSATEILAGMNVSVPVNSAGLAAYYKFDEGTGTTTADATGNGNNGTLMNSPVWQTLGSLEWMPGGQTMPTLSVNTTGTYYTKVTNPYGCTTALYKTVVVPVPATTMTTTGPEIICQGQSLTLGGSLDSNRAISFNKNNSQYITVPHSSSINLGATFTMEAWVNYSGSDVTIIDKGDYDFLWQLNKTGSGNKLCFQNKNTGPWVYSTGTVPINTWTHVAIVLNNGILRFFINGAPSGTAPVTYTQDNQPMTIGRQQPITGGCQCNHFNGTMDELRIWNIARTPTDLQNSRYLPVNPASQGLVAYYKFDEKSGNAITDASPFGNNGTMVNSPTRQSPSTSPFLAPVSTVWTPGGATTATITPTITANYKAVFTNKLGCVDSSSKSITVSSLPRPASGKDTTFVLECYGNTTNIVALAGLASGASFQVSAANPFAAPPGNYQVFASNSAGCVDTVSVVVKLDVATWMGVTNIDWHTPGNWSTNKVPGILTHVIIPGVTPFPCYILNPGAVAASIQVRNGGQLRTTNSRSVTVNGKCLVLPPN